MKPDRWKLIFEVFERGDPLKDIDCHDGELVEYIIKLKKEIKRLQEVEWKYNDLCK